MIETLKTDLISMLPTSTGEDRKKWAELIVENELDIVHLSELLKSDRATALRFQWLLSDIGAHSPECLHSALPHLFSIRKSINSIDFSLAFPSYWRICGVPEENEADAIELLFGILQSVTTDVTTKSRTLTVLLNLSKKYPDLNNELKVILKELHGKYSKSFDKRIEKALN